MSPLERHFTHGNINCIDKKCTKANVFIVAQAKATIQGDYTEKNLIQFDVDGKKINTFFNAAGNGKNCKGSSFLFFTKLKMTAYIKKG